MRFLGAYAAEGKAFFNQTNGDWQVCITNRNLEFLEQLQQDASLFTNTPGSIARQRVPEAHQLVFTSHILHLLVTTLCGGPSHEKRVPDVLYTLGDEYKRAFLDGYLGRDGDVQAYTVEVRRVTTNSPKLAAGLGLLFSLLGLDYYVGYHDFEEHRSAYSLNLASSHDSPSERKYSEHEYDGFVYDLTVEGTHNFAAGIGNIVVHNTHVDRSIMDPDAFITTDVYGTYVLLETTRKLGLERILLVSTDEVYGEVLEGSSKETDPLNGRSPYAASKAGGELLAFAYWHTYRTPILITRGGNNIGPYQYPENVVPLFITNAIDNEPLPLYGDGLQRRPYQYVIDHCEGIDVVLHKGSLGEAYNIGPDGEVANLEMARKILDLLGKPWSLIKHVADRPGHDRRYSLNCDKLKALGWAPRHTFDQALEKTVRWYVENEWWWRKIKSGEFKEYYRRQYAERLARAI